MTRHDLRAGNLTPRTNTVVQAKHYTGVFGQPDGFGSVLQVSVREDGRLVLTLREQDGRGWSVDLTNEQRQGLSAWIGTYQPVLWEDLARETVP